MRGVEERVEGLETKEGEGRDGFGGAIAVGES